MRTQQLSAVLAFAAGASACQRDFNIEARHTHRKPILRRNDVWPPVLTEQETLIANSFDNVTIDEWSEYYGRQNKLAGFGKEAAEWTRDKWASNGFESHLNEYHVFLRYPVSAALNFTDAEGNVSEVNLKEDVIEDDEVTGWDAISQQTFLGYAPTGHAKAEYVYAGRGSIADFEALAELGVDVKGKIALIRYGGLFRGLKVKNAQDAGALAAVIYLDPGDDGEVTVANGYKAYPEGPARNPHQVQKGSTLFLSTHPGDPTTPGYPSHEDAPRADVSDVIAKIPSVPISYSAAEPLLKALNGHGISGEQVNRTNWIGGLDAEYFTGPAPGVTLELDNVSEDVIRPIQNVIGRINGTNHDGTPAKETLFIGNHRDTWMIGGNGDPNSGSAILIEFSKVIKKLIDSGWKPKRNLVLGSWDAEEWGLIGSVEYVEEHINELTETLIAYLNIDVAVSGPRPDLSATPELHTIGTEIMKKVIHPNFGGFNQSLYDSWQDASGGVVGGPATLRFWLAPPVHAARAVATWLWPCRSVRVVDGNAFAAMHDRVEARLVAADPRPPRRRDAWYLSTLAVDPAVQGQGAGSWLVRDALSRIVDPEGAACWLIGLEGVEPFYDRFGFREIDRANEGRLADWTGGAVMIRESSQ
ncbi:glutamate carboxypeptidase like protein [Verticillium longisporum]|nr:glutamate carboxypeptidase like protein [Verticillium longisporum]